MRVVGIRSIDEAIGILMEFYPNSVADAEKARFVLKNMISKDALDAPQYPR